MQDLDSHSEGSNQEDHDLKSQEDDTLYMNVPDPNLAEQEQKNDEKKEDLDLTQSDEGFAEKIHRELQLIYIAKYSLDYRQNLEALAYQYACDINFGKNSFTISCKNKANQKKWTQCKEIIVQEFDKIIYKKVDDKDKRYRLLYSAQVNKYAMQQGIYFCQFNSEIYLHSNRYSPEQLQKKKLEITKYCNIFSVCFNKKKNIQAIDFEISKFYRTVLEDYYKERFEKNKMVVEVNRLDRTFYILGKPGATAHNMMDAKKTMKNLIEGITIVSFKNVTLDLKAEIKLKEYLKKISKYPITYGKLSQTVIVLISKDNILKELLKKTQKIMQKLCVQEDTSIGIYMPFCYSREDKRQQVYKICKEEGYDFWTNWGIRYFRPMIASEDDVKNPTEILNLIVRIIGGFVEVKENYEVMSAKEKPTNQVDTKKKKQLEEQDKYAYILKNSPKDSVELSKILRRDIMQDEVLMMKRYNVIYNLLDGDEIGPYYIDQSQYDKGVVKGQIKLLQRESLKKGQYFEVYLKIVPEQAEKKTLEEIEEMLVEELKKLKKAAKLDKEEGRSLDNQRKIAHMIKKQLDIF